MRSSRRRVLIGMGSTLATPWVAEPSFGQDAEFRLKLHHFLARNGNVPAKFIAPWARKIETESKDRIKTASCKRWRLNAADMTAA